MKPSTSAALSHHLEFDAAFGQVFHPAADIESAGEVLDGVSETDALDAAFEDDTFRNHDG